MRETFLASGLFLFIAYISRGKDGVPIVEQPLEASLLALHVILEPTAVVRLGCKGPTEARVMSRMGLQGLKS